MKKHLIALVLATSRLTSMAHAEYGYPQYDGYVYNRRPVPPPSWSYDPYTSGIAACPQWSYNDPTECTTLVPSYGQPGYSPWVTR